MKYLIFFSIFTFALSSHNLCYATHSLNNKTDKYKKFNNAAFKFNKTTDKVLFIPATRIYKGVLPKVVRTRVSDFFLNLNEPSSFFNNLFQGKLNSAMHDVARFTVNSTLGIFGLFDPAKLMGLHRKQKGFEDTINYYSHKKTQSRYIVLPFIGPTTLRSIIAMPFDSLFNPVKYIVPNANYILLGGHYINEKSKKLHATKMVYSSFDPQAAMKDAYRQLTKKNKK